MKLIDLYQGSPEWHEFRRTHANSSEAACIMGCAKYEPDTWLKLWRLKVGQSEPVKQNAAMLRGIEREPITRKWACGISGIDFNTAVGESGILGASFDGISPDGKVLLEIKNPISPDGDTWVSALKGEIEPHYLAQVQHSLMVSKADFCMFVVDLGDGVNTPVHMRVYPDKEYHDVLIDQWKKFWYHIEEFSPPEPSEKDIIVRTDKDWMHGVEIWRTAKKELELATERLEAAKKTMVELASGHASQGYGIRVQQVYRKGNVDYGKIPALKEIDLDQYRKKGSTFLDIREIKG